VLGRLTVLAALTVACGSGDRPACAVACGLEDSCPAGFTCLTDRFCHATPDEELCTLPDAPVPDASALDARPADAPPDAPSGPVTVTFGEVVTASYSGVTTDTSILSDVPDLVYGNQPVLDAMHPDNIATRHILIRFDVSAIPTTATVTQARVTFTAVDTSVAGNLTVYESLEPWDEGAATWNQRFAGASWSTSGGAVGGALNSFPVSPSSSSTVDLPAAVVDGWVSSPTANHGLQIRCATDPGNDIHLASRDHADTSSRPLLEVTYLP
jgi:hypothetical protein